MNDNIRTNSSNLSESKTSLNSSGLAEKVKELRKLTGFGFTECKNALVEANNDLQKATSILEAKNLSIAEKKVERQTKAGIISSYIHKVKNIPPQKGALIDLRCESDYVAIRPEFAALAKNLCMEIVIQSPEFISTSDIPDEIWKKQMDYELEIVSKKNDITSEDLEKIAKENTINYFKTKCLLNQRYSKDETLTIEEYIASHISLFRENIKVSRFERFTITND